MDNNLYSRYVVVQLLGEKVWISSEYNNGLTVPPTVKSNIKHWADRTIKSAGSWVAVAVSAVHTLKDPTAYICSWRFINDYGNKSYNW